MQWTKPDFQQISLGMEVTAYVNTDEDVRRSEDRSAPVERASSAAAAASETTA